MPLPVDAIKIQLIPNLDIREPANMHVEVNPQCVGSPLDAILMLQNAQTALINQVGNAEVAKAQRRQIVQANSMGLPS